MFDLGLLDLRAKAENRNRLLADRRSRRRDVSGMRYVPEEVKEMEVALGDQFLCNFSVFQSLLDHWALGQLFPVSCRFTELNELPDRNATIVDITCDSDGKVSKFVDLQDVKETLPLHRWEPGDTLLCRFLSRGSLPGHHGRHA